jgi:hypothetical protein
MATYTEEACTPLAWDLLPAPLALGDNLEAWHLLASADMTPEVTAHLFEHPRHPEWDRPVYAQVEETRHGARLVELIDEDGRSLLQ